MATAVLHNRPIKGVIHVGAHTFEEREAYEAAGIKNVVWIEADERLVAKHARKVQKIDGHVVLEGVIADKNRRKVMFNRMNNTASSSILEPKINLRNRPGLAVEKQVEKRTVTLDTLLKRHEINLKNYNLLNLDIQGAELLALKGAKEVLKRMDYVYTEVHQVETYAGCPMIGEIIELLDKYKFTKMQAKMVKYGWGDAFFRKERKNEEKRL